MMITDCRIPLLLLLAGTLAGCQHGASTGETPVVRPPTNAGAPAETDVTGTSPRIAVEKGVLDLGEVGTDTKSTGRFRFKNAGNAPLKIVQVYACCGVTARGVEDGQEYAPGESGTLEFDFHTGSTPVAEDKRELRLQTNDPEQNIVSLTIKAVVVRRVEHAPARLRLFLSVENAGCEDITIHSLDGRPFSISSFASTGNAISADFDPNLQAARFVLKLRGDMEALRRNVRGMVGIGLTHPECSSIRVPFDVLPEFTVNPAHLIVWDLRAGQPIERDIEIRGNYREDFEVESVSSQKGMVTLVNKRQVGGRCQLRIKIDAPAPQDEAAMATDTIEVKIKGGRTVPLPFRGLYVKG